MLRLWVRRMATCSPGSHLPPSSQFRNPQSSNRCSRWRPSSTPERGRSLGIPFYVINAEEPFKAHVVDFSSPIRGRPHAEPFLACNRKIRLAICSTMRGRSARAPGDGALCPRAPRCAGPLQLWRGAIGPRTILRAQRARPGRSRSGALPGWGVHQAAGARPGRRAGLPTASHVDSQELCFVADGNIGASWPIMRPRPCGPARSSTGGPPAWHAHGLPFYTIGQRSGLGIAAAQPLYVLELDMASNALIVGATDELAGPGCAPGRSTGWWASRAASLPVQRRRADPLPRHPATAVVTPSADGRRKCGPLCPLRDIRPARCGVL